jgi:ankyrin repeat protein
MQNNIPIDVFSLIVSYLPDESIVALMKITPILSNKLSIVKKDNIFWKQHTEVLLGRYLQNRLINWATVYNEIKKTIKYNHPFVHIKTTHGFNILIEAGYDPSADNNFSIISASKAGYTNIVQLLMTDPRVDPSADNNAASIFALQRRHFEVIILLLKDPRVDPIVGNLAILWASTDGYTNIIEILITDERLDPSYNNNAALLGAMKNKHTDIVNLLIKDKRVNPSIPFNKAIIYTSEFGQTASVEFLLKDPRVNPATSNNTPIKIASEKGHTEIVKLLLQDPRVDPSIAYNGPLELAAGNGHIEIVRLLLQDPRVDPSRDYNRPIRLAAENGHIKTVKLLLQDERVNPADYGNTALESAAKNGHTEIVKLLLQDSRVNKSNFSDAIKSSAKNGHIEVIKVLLQNSNIDLVNYEDEIILSAAKNGHIEIVKFLLHDPQIYSSVSKLKKIIEKAILNKYKYIVEIIAQSSMIDIYELERLINYAYNNGDMELVKLFFQNPKIKSAYMGRRFGIDNIRKIKKSLVKDARAGMFVMYYLYSDSFNFIDVENRHDISNLSKDKDIIYIYDVFLQYLIEQNPTLLNSINYLINLCGILKVSDRYIIHAAANNILNKSNFISESMFHYARRYFFAFKAYLLLVYEPRYNYQEILNIIDLESECDDCVKFAAVLLGAYLGLSGLKIDGLLISDKIQTTIDQYLNWRKLHF